MVILGVVLVSECIVGCSVGLLYIILAALGKVKISDS